MKCLERLACRGLVEITKIDLTEIPLNLERQLCHLLSMKPRTVVAKVAVAMHLTSQTVNYGLH